MQLRDYQIELINSIKQSFRQGNRSVCAVLSCGGGKSVIAANIAKSATDKDNEVLFIVHRRELCEQIRATFINCGVDMDFCTVGMVQTVTRRLNKIAPPGLIICDEAHHSLSASYMNIFERFSDALLIGFTATPVRLNQGGLGKVFQELIESVSTRWLIDNNFLSPYRYYSVQVADTSGVRITHGEYDSRQLSEIMEDKYIYGETVKNYRTLADGKKTIVYCVSVESAKQTAEEFRRNGYAAESLDGKTPKDERDSVMRRFRDNYITILCNCELFGEGLDVPDVECVILLRKTKSLTLYIQQAMRAMRYQPGKMAVIIDHVGNVYEHGFPDDEREWTLESKKRKKRDSDEMPVKQCENCYAVVPSGTLKCPYCDYEFLKKEVSEREVMDVDLQDITGLDVLRRKPYDYYRSIETWDKLEEFRKARAYKFMWSVYRALELGISVPAQYEYHVRRARDQRTEANA